jgi:hypothetical protein
MLYFFPVIIGCGSADVGFAAAVVMEVDARAEASISAGAGGVTGSGGKALQRAGTGGTHSAAGAAGSSGAASYGAGGNDVSCGSDPQCATNGAFWNTIRCSTDVDCCARTRCARDICIPNECTTDADCPCLNRCIAADGGGYCAP